MSTPISPVTFEVVRHRLTNINEDAAATLKRVSGSQIAVEANDLNTVIMAPDGRVVACGRYVLVQVASMHLVVADLLEQYIDNPGINPGDQFITNDPYVGTLHQPDVVLAAPVFYGDELVAWCASVVHQSDVGGPTPGGITYDARSIFDEAIPMAPMKIVEGERVRKDIEREYLIRSRTPELNALDLAGQIAANREAVRQVRSLCERYGTETLQAVLARLLASSESQLRQRLRSLPDGTWRHVAYVLHHDRDAPPSEQDKSYDVRLAMTKLGEHLELDFTDSSEQAPGAVNSSRASLVNFAMAALLIYLCNELPWVPGGIWPVVDIISRAGTVVDAKWPAGVAMSTSSSGQAIRICVNACVARMLDSSDELSELMMASCQSAGGGACTISGVDDDGRSFATMTTDDISGGGGARFASDGADSSGFTTSPGAAIANVEVNESYLPIRYLLRRELADSGGAGSQRGGVGTVQLIAPHQIHQPINVLSFGQGLQHPCSIGVAGGDPGGQSGFAIMSRGSASKLVESGSEVTPVVLPTAGMSMRPGEVQLLISQGGGGFGDPLERDPDAVALDVAEGLVTVQAAEQDYGVVVTTTAGSPAADHEATAGLRHAHRVERLGGRQPLGLVDGPGGRRFSHAFDLVPGATGSGRTGLVCRRCRSVLCDAADNVYEHAVIHQVDASSRAPFGLLYAGSDQFVIRSCYCPGCALQFDVQISRRDQPIVRAAEPVLGTDGGP